MKGDGPEKDVDAFLSDWSKGDDRAAADRTDDPKAALAAFTANRNGLDKARLEATRWTMPWVFRWLRKMGNIEDAEMYRTFNCGIGMVLVVAKGDCVAALATLKEHGVEAYEIGEIVQRNPDDPQTVIV